MSVQSRVGRSAWGQAEILPTEVVRGVLEATRDRAGAVRIVREAIWFTWEQPRLPRPLVGSKYPLPYPWSRAAWLRHEQAHGRRPAGGWGLVIEHLYPRELLIADLVTAEEFAASVVMELLASRIISAIITQDEDRRLPARAPAGSTWRDFEGDAWLRYRGIDIALLRPQLVHSPAVPTRSDATVSTVRVRPSRWRLRRAVCRFVGCVRFTATARAGRRDGWRPSRRGAL